MTFRKFSKRQNLTLTWWNRPRFREMDGIICDGSIRSGKTVSMTVGFLLWAMNTYSHQCFAICGKTIASLKRNIIIHVTEWTEGVLDVKIRNGENCLIIEYGDVINTFYMFGGKDEGSYALIQGMTLAGVLFDEVALMPQSFVEQAIARCSVEGSKLWFNCNPSHPQHWFYKEWVLKAGEKNCLYLHFTMNDNYSLSQKIRDRYEKMYSGVFYDRYIRGLWVAAEGVIYRAFVDNPQRYMIHRSDVRDLQYILIGHDIGGHKSRHTYVAVGFNRQFTQVTVLASRSLPATDTPVEYISDNLDSFADYIRRRYGFVKDVYADSAEQAILNTERARTHGLIIHNSVKNNILDRIRCENYMFTSDLIRIVEEDNEPLINGLKTAVWNEKKFEDERLDDGTSDICVLDAFEYAFEPYIKRIMRSA